MTNPPKMQGRRAGGTATGRYGRTTTGPGGPAGECPVLRRWKPGRWRTRRWRGIASTDCVSRPFSLWRIRRDLRDMGDAPVQRVADAAAIRNAPVYPQIPPTRQKLTPFNDTLLL